MFDKVLRIGLLYVLFFNHLGDNSPYSEEYEMYEEPDKMTYTEQANKRSRCRRLTR